MYAVIETGGKQYRVSPGDTIRVERLEGEIGAEVQFDKVLAVVDDSQKVLTGSEAGRARVRGTIAAQDRGPKVLVFKFKRKKQYKRTIGHRQDCTAVKVSEILV